MAFLHTYVYFIALSFLVSLIVLNNKQHPYLKFFSPFLLATLLTESIASYRNSIGENNISIYNFFSVFEFSFYLVMISMIIQNTRAKLIMRISSLVYAVISAGNIIFFQGMNAFHTITYSFGCLLIVAACIYYFFELFRLPKHVKLVNNPAFWICSGLLFFYCCGFPLYAFLNFWARFKWMISNFKSIINILNIFLYSLFTIAFLCSRTRKFTLSSS